MQNILMERSVQAALERGLQGSFKVFKELRVVGVVSWELGMRHKGIEQLSRSSARVPPAVPLYQV